MPNRGPILMVSQAGDEVKETLQVHEAPKTHKAQIAYELEADTNIRFASVEMFRTFTNRAPEFQKFIARERDPLGAAVDAEVSGIAEKFAYSDGLIWFMGTAGRFKADPERWRVWVPQELRYAIMIAAHHCPLQSHPGVERMKWAMERRFYWASMNADIGAFVQGCAQCARAKRSYDPNKGLLGQFDITSDIFDTVHMDYVGPLPETAGGFKYVLTVIDRASNYVITIPTADDTKETTARMLIDHVFSRIGVPRKIISDRGSSFINWVSDELSAHYGFKWRYVTAYNPMANGKIERMHRTMKASLKIYCQDNQLKWPETIHAFTFAVNNLGSSSLGATARLCPHQLVYGRVLNTPMDHLKHTALYEPTELMASRLRAIAEAEHIVTKQREAEMRRRDNKEQQRFKHVEFQRGDTVLLYVPAIPVGISSKLYEKWQGPYQIIKQTAAYNYRIRHQKTKKEQIVHVRRLVKFSPFLLEYETEEDALERTKDQFGNPTPLLTRSQRADEIARIKGQIEGEQDEEEKAKLWEAVKQLETGSHERPGRGQRLGEQIAKAIAAQQTEEKGQSTGETGKEEEKKATDPRRRKRGRPPSEAEPKESERISPKPQETRIEVQGKHWISDGEMIDKISWQRGKFYLMRPADKDVADETLDDFYVMRIIALQETGKVTRSAAAKGLAPVMQFWRSKDDITVGKGRRYQPVLIENWGNHRETWDYTIKEDDEDHIPYAIKSKPRLVLDIPFDLTTERMIPSRIWDEVEAQGLPFDIIGAPPSGSGSRGKKRPRERPIKKTRRT